MQERPCGRDCRGEGAAPTFDPEPIIPVSRSENRDLLDGIKIALDKTRCPVEINIIEA
jgi:hypothetical protein